MSAVFHPIYIIFPKERAPPNLYYQILPTLFRSFSHQEDGQEWGMMNECIWPSPDQKPLYIHFKWNLSVLVIMTT
jgi:hypothetical protein